MDRIGLKLFLSEQEIPFIEDGGTFIVQAGHSTVTLRVEQGEVRLDGFAVQLDEIGQRIDEINGTFRYGPS